MNPVLWRLGAWEIPSYGLLVAAGFLSGAILTFCLSRRAGLSFAHFLSLGALCMACGLGGARLLQALADLLQGQAARLDDLGGGRAALGGAVLAVVGIFLYSRLFRIEFAKNLDMCFLGGLLSSVFGRLGCFFAGCCHGKPTDSLLGVQFPASTLPQYAGAPLHPIQLYEAAGLLILFLILMMWRKRKAFEGELALTGFMAYSLIRFFLEFVRGDADRGFVLHGWLSISQLVSLVLFVVCAGVLLLQHRWAAGLRGERLEQRQSPDVLKRAA